MPETLFVLNGPNLNLLGRREPGIYGTESLADIEALCRDHARHQGGCVIDFRQTNHEGTLLDWLHEADAAAGGVVLNPGAYTHTSIALHDAIRAISAPVIEVHLSNIFAREAFRHHSHVSPAALGVICGLGATGYLLAITALTQRISAR